MRMQCLYHQHWLHICIGFTFEVYLWFHIYTGFTIHTHTHMLCVRARMHWGSTWGGTNGFGQGCLEAVHYAPSRALQPHQLACKWWWWWWKDTCIVLTWPMLAVSHPYCFRCVTAGACWLLVASTSLLWTLTTSPFTTRTSRQSLTISGQVANVISACCCSRLSRQSIFDGAFSRNLPKANFLCKKECRPEKTECVLML